MDKCGNITDTVQYVCLCQSGIEIAIPIYSNSQYFGSQSVSKCDLQRLEARIDNSAILSKKSIESPKKTTSKILTIDLNKYDKIFMILFYGYFFLSFLQQFSASHHCNLSNAPCFAYMAIFTSRVSQCVRDRFANVSRRILEPYIDRPIKDGDKIIVNIDFYFDFRHYFAWLRLMHEHNNLYFRLVKLLLMVICPLIIICEIPKKAYHCSVIFPIFLSYGRRIC